MRAVLCDSPYGSSGAWALADSVGLVVGAVDHLRSPMTDIWQLEAAARGRIRRWARWQIEGAASTQPAVAAVAAALEAGHVPQPPDAVLVDVVDQRPPPTRRRSAGLGRAGWAR